jgi:hypothetical protein
MADTPKKPHKSLNREGFTPSYQAYHEVYITKNMGYERNSDLIDFIDKHIADFKGKVENKHGIPTMLFERVQDASRFADALKEKLNIPKEHVSVKAQKFTR